MGMEKISGGTKHLDNGKTYSLGLHLFEESTWEQEADISERYDQRTVCIEDAQPILQ
mgnify:FL=1